MRWPTWPRVRHETPGGEEVTEMKAIVVRKLQPSKTVQKTIIAPYRI